jgi:hypothetical protein
MPTWWYSTPEDGRSLSQEFDYLAEQREAERSRRARMFHPHAQLADIGGDVGLALVASRPIPAGTVMWALCDFDIILDRHAVAELSAPYREILDRYAFISPDGDSILQWDLARFGNHCCEAVLHSVGFDVEIAVRDIAAGEQITTEYGSLNRDFHFACACGARRCRTHIRRDDSLHHGREWDERVARVLPLYSSVEQPLAPVLARRPHALEVLEGRLPPPPSSGLYCPASRLPDLTAQGGGRSAPSARSPHSVTMPLQALDIASGG